jgi:hypothetical protein
VTTQLSNLEFDIAYYMHLKSYLDKISGASNLSTPLCYSTLEWMLTNGMVQVSTIFEQVMAVLTNGNVTSKDSHDLSNGADCKLTTARFTNYKSHYKARVGDVYNKTGTLYVLCFEKLQKNFYYFAIPSDAYSKIPKSSNIEIPFETDGTPRRTPAGYRKYVNWWNYECESLEDMATFCGTTGKKMLIE